MADISQDVVTFTKNGNMSNIEPGDTLALNFQRIQGRFDAMKSLAYQDKLEADDFDPSVTYPANFVNNNGLRTFRDKPSAFELALKDDILINRLQFLTPTKVEICYDTVTYEEFTGSFNDSGMVDMLIEGKAAGWTVPDGTYGIKLYFTATEAMTLSDFFLNIDTHGEHSFSLTLQKSGAGQTDITTCTWSNIYTNPEINTDGYAVVTHEPFEWSPDGSRFICVTIGDIYPSVDVPSALPVVYEAGWYGASPKGQRKPYHQDRNQNVVFDKPVILPEGSDVGDFVKFVPQSLTDSQKAYARDNIDAASETHTHDGYASSTHTHSATDIVQDSTHKFVTDAQKEQWSAKAEANHIHTGYASSSHTHGATDITEDSTHRFVTDTEKASWNGKADLVDGKVPASQLPSFVDDVLEYANLASFPTTGESGKIYVALNDNKTYRWGGTEYVVISDTIALGETAQTAYRGDHGKFAYDHAQNSDVHVTATQKDYWSSKAEGDHVHPISGITSLQAELNGKASTDHIHGYTEISGLMAQLNSKASSDHTHTGYAASGHTHSYNDLTDKPTIPEAVTVDSALSATSENAIQNKVVKNALDGKADVTHTHGTSDITGLSDALNGKANTSHTHSTSDISGLSDSLSGKANATHTHGTSDITGLSDALAGKASSTHTHSYNDLSDKPTIPAAVTVDATLSDTSENPIQNKAVKAALDGKAGSTHSHAVGDITGLETALEGVGCEKVIKTQAQFNALLASEDWLGAESVVFSGEFTHTGPIGIPDTVMDIRGLANTVITITSSTENLYIGWSSNSVDESIPTQSHSISGISVVMTQTGTGNSYGFMNCCNVDRCTCHSTANAEANAFRFCRNVTNCTGETISQNGGYSVPFNYCENVVSCEASGSSTNIIYEFGYRYCTGCQNCTGEADKLFANCEGDPFTCEGIGKILVINTQDKFNRYMVASDYPDNVEELWIVGEYNTTQQITLPYYIYKVKGLGKAKINFTTSSVDFRAFAFAATASYNVYSVENLSIEVNCVLSVSDNAKVIGFDRVGKLSHCWAKVKVTRNYSGLVGSIHAYAYHMCTDASDCRGETNVTETGEMNYASASYSCAFYSCKGVTNGYGYAVMTLNSTATTNSPTASSYAFYNCQRLFNCMGDYANGSNITKMQAVFMFGKYMFGCTETSSGQANVYSNCTDTFGCVGATAS